MCFRQLLIHDDIVLVQNAIKGYWRNFEIFHVFFISSIRTTRVFWEGYVFGFEQ